MATSRAPVGIDADTIVDTAIRLIDELGAQAVTARRLAAELHVTTPVLYWHVGNKDALWTAVIERVFQALPIPENATRGWEEQVRQYMSGAFEHLLEHPGVLELANVSHVVWSGSAARWATEGYRILRRAGFDDEDAGVYGQALMLQIVGMARQEASIATHTPVLEPSVDADGRVGYRVKPELLADNLPAGLRRMAWLDVHAHRDLVIEMTITALRSALRRRRAVTPRATRSRGRR
jgi:AcrR family transcriptional regulator